MLNLTLTRAPQAVAQAIALALALALTQTLPLPLTLKAPKHGGASRHAGGEGSGWPCPSCGRGFACLRALAAHHEPQPQAQP